VELADQTPDRAFTGISSLFQIPRRMKSRCCKNLQRYDPLVIPRLKHVAQHAGVSEATVSRVVNNRPGVSDATRKRVLEAIAEFQYEPTGLPREGRAGLVGLLIPELSNPIFPTMAQVINEMLAGHRFTTVLCTATVDGVSEDDYVEMLLGHGMAGLVVVSGKNADTYADHALYRRLFDRGVPMVFLNGSVTGVDAPVMSSDDAHAADIAVRHLATLGHRAIALTVGPRRYLPVQRRLLGYRMAMESLGLPELIADSTYSVEGGEAAARVVLQQGATGIVAASDLMALGAVRAARAMGFDVPAEVSVVGYDDNALLPFMDPPLTSVRQPLAAMCEAAVLALVDQIAGVAQPARELMFRAELVLRGSTASVRTRLAAAP
jgi:alanine racemase